jgi:hypothetical protein
MLSQMSYTKQKFDPISSDHVETYRMFMKDSKWEGGCPFYLEWPYLTIPDMIKDKIVRNLLNIEGITL